MHVYIKSEPGLWTVGHYAPSGKWHAYSDHSNEDEAARRVAVLNGSDDLNIKCVLDTLATDAARLRAENAELRRVVEGLLLAANYTGEGDTQEACDESADLFRRNTERAARAVLGRGATGPDTPTEEAAGDSE